MSGLPLDGIRVVDITVVWSGPGATMLLGDLGAEVIRVEGANRLTRQTSAKATKESVADAGYHAAMYPEQDPGERPYDRSAIFNWHARNKLAASMQLETPEGHRAVLDLLAVSDVLVENNANLTMDKLGLSHDRLRELFPRLVIARMPPMGFDGPMSGYVGYGPNFNALVGIAAMDGYEGEDPASAGENYHMDEASPAALVFAVIAALIDRERTGRGTVIEFSQAENVLQDVGEFIVDQQLTGNEPRVWGNGDPHAVQGVFATSEPEQWVAISACSEPQKRALEQLVADPGNGADVTADIRDRLAYWTASRTRGEVVDELQLLGVAASAVLSETAVFADPHLRAREWFRVRSHPALGERTYPGHPWRAEEFELAFGRPFPGFGEDNEYVYRDVMGYSAEEYKRLVELGAITDEQNA